MQEPNTPALKSSGQAKTAACRRPTPSSKLTATTCSVCFQTDGGLYDTDAIARFVETEGRDGDVSLEFPRPVRATETTLLEDVKVGDAGEGKTIQFHMKPWEIKTLRLSPVQ